jgi:solute carrier family 25 thiamine pyrophosphate transporter 19
MDAARGVVQRQGVQGLYSGLSVTLLEIMPYAALQFGLYDIFTRAAEKAHGASSGPNVRIQTCLLVHLTCHAAFLACTHDRWMCIASPLC